MEVMGVGGETSRLASETPAMTVPCGVTYDDVFPGYTFRAHADEGHHGASLAAFALASSLTLNSACTASSARSAGTNR